MGYLCLLGRWLWEDPKSVRELLDAGGLGVVSVDANLIALVSQTGFVTQARGPINQTTETESLAPGLCAFLFGLYYEFKREPGEITRSEFQLSLYGTAALTPFLPHRSTFHPIMSRFGVDALIGQMARAASSLSMWLHRGALDAIGQGTSYSEFDFAQYGTYHKNFHQLDLMPNLVLSTMMVILWQRCTVSLRPFSSGCAVTLCF